MSASTPGHVTTRPASITARHVFISFASEDLELARRVVERLERSGFRCWISERDIEPGASYPAAITSAVVASGALVLLLTGPANSSPHVVREIELAFNNRTPILPVRLSGVQPSSDLQYFLSTTQWFDAGSTVDDTDFRKVESRLEQLLQSGRVGGAGDDAWRRWLPLAAGIIVLIAVVGAALFFTASPRDEALPSGTVSPAASETGTTPVPATPDATSKEPTARVNPRDGQTYIWVAPGRFVMGCSDGDPDCADDEKPTRSVEMKSGFWLARTETTRAQYARATSTRQVSEDAAGDLPMTGVTWESAKAHCASVGGRLPSEVEWEYAARAGSTTRYYGVLADVAWFADNAADQVHPVGTKAPNALGLHDMLGNVSEWVRDRYYNAYDDTADPAVVEEPLAGNALGVARGGSWVSDADGVRLSRRLEMYPDAEEAHIGFRCAADQP